MEIEFDRLQDLPLREAWKNEAHDFTPWLAENIEHLSETIGVPLELTGTEVAVDSFSADILARNLDDDSSVLIENQLEMTDHRHLGQIMTYLAGLEAQTVVWIAPAFRDPHLSAVRWLNENTSDGFSFFAVRARVVRIGNSPFAPIFEIAEKPDGWSRSLTAKKRQANETSDAQSDLRIAFWTHYANRHPDSVPAGIQPRRGWNSYFEVIPNALYVSIWIGDKNSGIYVTGGRAEQKLSAQELLSPHVGELCHALGAEDVSARPSGHVCQDRFPQSYLDKTNWSEITDWMEERRTAYIAEIQSVLGRTK